ncbi:MAG: hypothetical protein AAF518_26100 [Spirochaetota bacterium]
MEKKELYGQKINFLNWGYLQSIKSFLDLKYGISKENRTPLATKELAVVPGLKVLQNGTADTPLASDGVVVGTVRMGYGHHRMAYSLYSWSLAAGKETYLHDILAIESSESTAIREIDGLYSYWSRLSSEMGGPVEWFWGQLTAQGNISSLLLSLLLAEEYVGLMDSIPRELPYLSTYPINGQIAVARGQKKVIHLVPDNYPQYYIIVPGALNLVQSPASYMKFLEMGVPESELMVAGHWISRDIMVNLQADTEARIKRIDDRTPARIFLPIGGAGAQGKYVKAFIEQVKDKLIQQEFFLLLNVGDHQDVFEAMQECLRENSISYQTVRSRSELEAFVAKYPLDSSNPEMPVTLFFFTDYYDAFSASDILIRASDILMTKPSELAFFPVPKLFIRRVGDHEEASAFRSMELGEGTIECREVEHAVEMARVLTESKDIILRMNDCILRNLQDGIYDGSKNAIALLSD